MCNPAFLLEGLNVQEEAILVPALVNSEQIFCGKPSVNWGVVLCQLISSTSSSALPTTDPWPCRVTVGKYWDLWKLWDPVMEPLLFQTVWGTSCNILLSLASGSDGKPELAGERAVGGRQAFSYSQGIIVFHLDDVQCKGLLIKTWPIPVPKLKLFPSGNTEPYFGCFKVE